MTLEELSRIKVELQVFERISQKSSQKLIKEVERLYDLFRKVENHYWLTGYTEYPNEVKVKEFIREALGPNDHRGNPFEP